MTEAATIINVDDHEPARYARGRILSHAGFLVLDAATGSDALNLIAEHNPDMVLLDVHLPDVSGIEICRRVKATPECASVIVLQISASAITAPQATAALNNGADGYLTEPVDADVLVATVKALLRLRKAERELANANDRLKTLNQELSRSNEDLQQFAFAASHDLQEPLRTINAFASLLGQTAAAKLDQNEHLCLKYISEGAQRMRALIDDLLSYSQVGRTPGAHETVDLNPVLSSVLEDLREGLIESDADVAFDPLPLVMGDESQLRHVFQNLIGNAIKYSRKGVKPAIRVSATRGNQDWVIRISDNGIGIDPSYLKLVFAAFKRLHGKDVPGTGIGLAICRRAIEAHGGRIWAESVVGEGSTFFFSLMATANAAQTSTARP
jgi:signal transduction histidine kinase